MEVLQMVVGMGEGKDFCMTAVFLVPNMSNIFHANSGEDRLTWQSAFMLFVLIGI